MSREKSATPVQTFVLRIFTFGSLEIVWEGTSLPFPPERVSGRGAAPALSLLKLLLCQPSRFASRDVIMEQFWPDSPRATAEERLHDVATSLRRLLRPPEDHSKILYYIPAGPENASGYRLEAHPSLWVDADAFRWNLEQALRMERYGHPSFAFWDRAYQLASRGIFLQEEVYTSWPLSMRRLLDGQYRQCVHRLAHLLREAGMVEEAMMRLHSYWQTSPTDEDALRSLMEMLGEQERFGEAEQYYQQALEAFKQDGKEPDRRTLDVRECLQAQQIMRRQKRASVVQPAAKQEIVVSSSSNNQPDMTSIPLSQAIKEGIIGAVCELRELSTMKRSNLLDRRTCIEWLISIFPLLLAKDELFTPTQEESRTSFTSLASLREQAPYTLFEDVLAMGWESTYRGGSKHLAEHIDQHLSLLAAQANHASTTEMGSWLSLLCRYYQLASRLAQRHLQPKLAVLYAQQALNLAISLENTELKALGFFWRARLHLEQQQPELARRDTTAALDLAERVRVGFPEFFGGEKLGSYLINCSYCTGLRYFNVECLRTRL